jgi:hypothetical protein
MEKRTSRAERVKDRSKTFSIFRNVTRWKPEDEGSKFFAENLGYFSVKIYGFTA